MRLRSLCGLTAEQFSRVTGIGYAQLVAVEQGRRELSQMDAMLISAATGVDPSFNTDKTNNQLKTLFGMEYHEGSFDLWKNQDFPLYRRQAEELMSSGQDPFAESLAHNICELLAAARVRGQEMAIQHFLAQVLWDAGKRFGITDAVRTWKEVVTEFKTPKKLKRGLTKCVVSMKLQTRHLPGVGRG